MDDTGTTSVAGAPAGDEVWTVGEAATYLNAGGIDFRIKPKTVRRWADDPRKAITTAAGGNGRWRRVLASSVRAERARLLRSVGREDPDLTPPPAG